MTTNQTVHRAALDGYTECGRSLDSKNIQYQPAEHDSPDGLTCKRCIDLLTVLCFNCNEHNLTYRFQKYDRFRGCEMYFFNCVICGKRVNKSEEVGKRQRNRENRARLKRARARREALNIKFWAKLAAEHAAKEEIGQYLPGCPVCGVEWSRGNWYTSSVNFLEWRWCPEHAELGKEFDQTIVATFTADALSMVKSIAERIA